MTVMLWIMNIIYHVSSLNGQSKFVHILLLYEKKAREQISII
jgi:hypothetical protein